jgi:hypothetical protein
MTRMYAIRVFHVKNLRQVKVAEIFGSTDLLSEGHNVFDRLLY